MLTKKMVALTVAATAGLAVAACSDSGETAPETVTETVAPETVTETSNAGAAVSEDLPAAVTGYSDEARKDLVDENVTEAEVQDVLKAAQDGKAKVEWDDDGYFEVEFGEIDIDIDKDGLVLDVDR
ncbi:hypothetical protein HMPREF2785_02440 [Corynebacterium sp. HMSC067D03]|uniref:PepSY domain-containing protein n=1 Tax=Corynebacterium coyleae TaxID=53374 RepID=A0AAP7CD49_9CORY|nr:MULTISPECIES: hypothetical protein [Corynebacterium]NJJ04621.1 hypothetical protein [Corynebacterium coyleae]OFL17538.1 hypothetical protein HMPREF2785_02440 [Corynebacterium sp. HMSC067D03]OFL93564.1 hypothetical protein HMPREF2734_01070 [Corynebacterium sp. HMSC055D05]OFO32466.1 hypothetical protein HMPREF3048_03060 [Corynebacterium sp. HMSC075D04]OHO31131.1 hypothetical protein HMPREF2656_10565 [Corynebacterium sp. HMSC034B08]